MKLADIASNTAIPGSHMTRTMKTRWLILIIILFAGCVWYANYSLHFNGFMWNDSQDYNQMARNVYEGKGFSTSVLRPISFSIFDYLPHPEYTRPPLYAYLLALCYRMFGVNDPAAVLVDGIFFVVFAIATYLYAMEYSKSRLSAVLITTLLICSPWVLVMSIQGSTDIVFAALFMLFLYLFARFYERPALAGLLAGLLYLVRWNAVFIVGAFILTEYNPFKEKSNWKRTIAFSGGALLGAMPVLVRNMLLQGSAVSSINSQGLIMNTKTWPGYLYWSQLSRESTWDFIGSHPWEFYDKLGNQFFMLFSGFPAAFGNVTLLLMVAGLLVPLKDASHVRMQRILIWVTVVQVIFLVPLSPEARYFGFVVPALITIVFTAIGTLSHPRFRIAGQVIIVIVVVALSARYWLKPKPFNYYRDLGVAVKAETGRDDVIISDLAWAMSWYGNRKAVWLTYDIDTMDKISKTIPIKYAFISVETVIRPLLPYKDNVWQKLFIEPSADSVPGFKLVKTFYVHKQPLGVLYKIERSQASSLP